MKYFILALLLLTGCGHEGTPPQTALVAPLVCSANEVKVPEPSGWGEFCQLKVRPTPQPGGIW